MLNKIICLSVWLQRLLVNLLHLVFSATQLAQKKLRMLA